ncbi:hypothetical protein BGX27_003254, partial [Mortierella sp. AM989]
VNIIGVKVLDMYGTGSTSSVVAGMDWVAKRAVAGKSVVNMSLGGSEKSKVVDDASARIFAKNIPLIVAAGNFGWMDACDISPPTSSATFAVASSGERDEMSYFSSFGKCVEIFAPGENITSSFIGSTTASAVLSGTSMAAPHVAGAAALYLSATSLPTAKSVYDKLISTATLGKIKGGEAGLRGTPNRLVFNGAV